MTPTPEAETHCDNRFWGPAWAMAVTFLSGLVYLRESLTICPGRHFGRRRFHVTQAAVSIVDPMKLYQLLIPLCTVGFVAFWCLGCKMASLMGWGRLATHFQVPALSPGPRYSLGLARLGVGSYQNTVDATVSSEGMGLAADFIYRVGHPPLLIPWSAFGPFGTKKSWLLPTYRTTIQFAGASIILTFTSARLLAAARPWIQMA